MINLSIEAIDAGDLKRQLRELLGDERPRLVPSGDGVAFTSMAHPVAEANESLPQPETKRRGRPPKDTTQPAVEQVTSASGDQTSTQENQAGDDSGQTAESTASRSEEIGYDTHIKPAVLKVSAAKGRAGVEKLLGEFGVDHATKVPVERYQALLDAVDAILEG